MAELLLTPPDGDNNFIMSHSEVDSFNDCEKKWDYAHQERLAPAQLNDRLLLGTYGHLGLEIYYKAIAAGKSHEEAKDEGEQAITDTFATENLQLAAKAVSLVRNYHRAYGKESWHIKYVEQEFYLFVETYRDTNLWFAIKPDLIVQEPLRTGVTVVDHKFTGRFYSGTTISTSPQMVRYSSVLSQMGLPLHRCIYNQIHSAPTKTNPKYVERAPFTPTYSRYKNTWEDTVITMRQIADTRLDGKHTKRQPGPMKCNMCLAEPLCTLELNGTDSSLMRRVNFRPNTYGYGLKTEE